jgi:hypothetical protein
MVARTVPAALSLSGVNGVDSCETLSCCLDIMTLGAKEGCLCRIRGWDSLGQSRALHGNGSFGPEVSHAQAYYPFSSIWMSGRASSAPRLPATRSVARASCTVKHDAAAHTARTALRISGQRKGTWDP